MTWAIPCLLPCGSLDKLSRAFIPALYFNLRKTSHSDDLSQILSCAVAACQHIQHEPYKRSQRDRQQSWLSTAFWCTRADTFKVYRPLMCALYAGCHDGVMDICSDKSHYFSYGDSHTALA